MKFDRSRIKKILVIKPAAIGDVLLSTPVIENLRYNFADAEINFLTQAHCKEILTGNPYVSRILTYDLSEDGSYCLIKSIRGQNYDLVIDLFCNPRTALITFLSTARYRVGFPFRLRSYAYNIKVKPRGGEVHNIEFNLDALRHLGLGIISNRPYFALSEIHHELAKRFITETGLDGGNIIGINPSGTWETKVWYPENFIRLIGMFGADNKFLLFWGNEKEKAAAENIKLNSGTNVHLIPEVNLKYAAALMKKCEIFLSNDTGPMHIAWVLGVPVCGIYGPTNSELQGPLGGHSVIARNEELDCLGCNLTEIKDCPYGHACMRDLSPEYVYEKMKELLN